MSKTDGKVGEVGLGWRSESPHSPFRTISAGTPGAQIKVRAMTEARKTVAPA
jgi:hypothetical protein